MEDPIFLSGGFESGISFLKNSPYNGEMELSIDADFGRK